MRRRGIPLANLRLLNGDGRQQAFNPRAETPKALKNIAPLATLAHPLPAAMPEPAPLVPNKKLPPVLTMPADEPPAAPATLPSPDEADAWADAPPPASLPRDPPANARGAADWSQTVVHTAEVNQRMGMVSALDIVRTASVDNGLSVVADAVARLGNDEASDLSGPWNMRMVLDENIFPATTLDIALSHQELSLRFASEAISTLRLISANQDFLRKQLEEKLNPPRSIHIEITPG